jgi:hypothetical protein
MSGADALLTLRLKPEYSNDMNQVPFCIYCDETDLHKFTGWAIWRRISR